MTDMTDLTQAPAPLILTQAHGRVGLVRFNRPKQLNALNEALIAQLDEALMAFDTNPAIGAIIITGNAKAFAAGADIREMQARSFPASYLENFLARWGDLARTRKPLIAAVAGFALGGGCELAMACDMIVAADTAVFGQPEINLGIIPGAGGTQRLVRAIGKARAMDMILTGRTMTADEAFAAGLVSRLVTADQLETEALDLATRIAALSAPAVLMAKEAVNRAFEGTLSDGLRTERLMIQALFGTEGQREGMAAFLEKRPARFVKD